MVFGYLEKANELITDNYCNDGNAPLGIGHYFLRYPIPAPRYNPPAGDKEDK